MLQSGPSHPEGLRQPRGPDGHGRGWAGGGPGGGLGAVPPPQNGRGPRARPARAPAPRDEVSEGGIGGGGVLSPRPLSGALPAPSRWLRPPRSRPEVVPGASRLSAGPSWVSSGLWLRLRIAQGPRSALLPSHPRAWGEAGGRIDKKRVPYFSSAAPEGTGWRLFA